MAHSSDHNAVLLSKLATPIFFKSSFLSLIKTLYISCKIFLVFLEWNFEIIFFEENVHCMVVDTLFAYQSFLKNEACIILDLM